MSKLSRRLAAVGNLNEFAAHTFEPIDDMAVIIGDLTEPTWGQMVNDLGVALRLAVVTVQRPKEGLVEVAAGLPDKDIDWVLAQFEEWQQRLEFWAHMLGAAYLRQLVGAAVAQRVVVPFPSHSPSGPTSGAGGAA